MRKGEGITKNNRNEIADKDQKLPRKVEFYISQLERKNTELRTACHVALTTLEKVLKHQI